MISSIGSTTGTWSTFPLEEEEISLLQLGLISAERHENIYKGVVNPTKQEE
jgi:hypothetical protein